MVLHKCAIVYKSGRQLIEMDKIYNRHPWKKIYLAPHAR